MMFLGEYSPNLTDGSRIALPKKLREQIKSGQVVLSKGFEKCILVYDRDDWVLQAKEQIEDLRGAAKTGDLKRYLYSSASETTVDPQGRMVIPGDLKDYAGIEESTAVIGVGDHIEIWNKDVWAQRYEDISKEISA